MFTALASDIDRVVINFLIVSKIHKKDTVAWEWDLGVDYWQEKRAVGASYHGTGWHADKDWVQVAGSMAVVAD